MQMLTFLKVTNFALIEDVEIEFKTGFTAFVGETGAGKSLLVDAINMLSGARSSASFVKKGTDYAEIQGAFFLPEDHVVYKILEQYGVEVEPGEDILVSRRITKEGRTTCRIQGIVVSAQVLKQMMNKLVDIHGQHENNYLLEDKNHIALLDIFAGNSQELSAYRTSHETYQKLIAYQSELERLKDEVQSLPLFEKQLDELIEAKIEEGEIDTLKQQFQDNKEITENFHSLQQAQALLTETEITSHLYTLQQLMQQTANPNLLAMKERISSVYYDLEDMERTIHAEVDSFEMMIQAQSELEARMDQIFTLQRKYGEDLISAKTEIEAKINHLQNIEYDVLQNEKRVAEQHAEVLNLGKKLTETRKIAAEQLSIRIMQELQDLYLEHVEFTVRIEPTAITARGVDSVTFYIKTNIGQESQPLSAVASGGELSRIMLAIKVVFAQQQTLSTIIFDEIDTGVSGKVAQAIAKKMQVFSTEQQVFAITHLPQVLSASMQQLNIWKYVADDETHVNVKYLTPDEHVEEVAKMLSGTEIHQSGLEHATELIKVLQS